MKIVIDTNVYLNFFRREGEQSLTLLTKLISFVEKDKFEILLPCQIEDEYWRKKQEVIDEYVLELERGLNIKISLPIFLKLFKKSKDLKTNIKKINSLKKDVIVEYKKRAVNPKSEINKKINKLFSFSTKIKENKEILEKAYFRTLKGNPPRKGNKSFGDAIIWEMILENYKDDDLIIISGDGDYSEKNNNVELHGYLKREWNEKTKKSVRLYSNLGVFINEQSGKRKPIKKEDIQEEDYLNILGSQINNIQTSDISLLNDNHHNNASRIINAGGLASINNLLTSAVHCSSCNKLFEYDINSLSINQDKCQDCRDKIYNFNDSPTRLAEISKCDICGEEFYYNGITNTVNLSEKKCSKCFNK